MAKLTGSLQVDGNISADSFTGSVQGTATSASYISIDNIDGDIQATNADLADTASYVSGSSVDGEVYEAERARRIEVGSYNSYSGLTNIPFVTGIYGSNISRISSDGALRYDAGDESLLVPKYSGSQVDVTNLTGSLDWSNLLNIPDGIMSSSDGVIPDGTVSSSAQTIANLNSTGIVSGSSQITLADTTGNISGSRVIGDIAASSVDYANVNNKPTLLSSSAQINFDTDPINIAIGGTSLGSAYRLLRGNVAIGAKAYECVTNVCDLEQNVAVGLCAGRSIDSDSVNSIFIGTTAGGDTSACQNSNIGIGSGAHSCGGGTGNVSIGSVAGQDTTGDYNVAIGFTAARDNVGGDGNVVIGGIAGRCMTGNGSYHVLLGYNAGSTTFYNSDQFSTSQSGSVFAVNAGIGNEPTIHGRFGAWGGVTDYFCVTATTFAPSFEGDSFTGSLDFSNVDNKPTLFSGSSQVDFDNITNVPDELVSASDGDVTIDGVLEIAEGPGFSTQQNMIIGLNSATYIRSSSTSDNNTVIGVEAGYAMQSGSSDNVVIGSRALYNNGGAALGIMTSNTLIGHEVMDEGYGIGNVVVGRQSMLRASSANSNVVLGNNSLDADDYNGSNTVVIGPNAAKHITGGSYNIIIGRAAGPTTNGSLTGKLYIDTEESDTPLIYGDFVSDELTINGDLDVTGTTSGSFIGDGSGLTNISATIPDGTVSSSAQINLGDATGTAANATSASYASTSSRLDSFTNVQNTNGQHALLMTRATSSADQDNGEIGFAGTNTSLGSLKFNPNRGGNNNAAELTIGASGITGILDVDRIDMGADIIINDGVINLLGVQNGGSIAFSDVSDPSGQNTGHLWRDGTELYFGKSTNDKSKVVTDTDSVLKMAESDPLPSGGVGQLAVSASNLYFHNGSNWSQIN